MTEPLRLLKQRRDNSRRNRQAQYVVREAEADSERQEIAAEFYPNQSDGIAETIDSAFATEDDEQCARICMLARKLGFNETKIKMKLGQWAGNLAGLERELLDEMDALPDDSGRGRRRRRPS